LAVLFRFAVVLRLAVDFRFAGARFAVVLRLAVLFRFAVDFRLAVLLRLAVLFRFAGARLAVVFRLAVLLRFAVLDRFVLRGGMPHLLGGLTYPFTAAITSKHDACT
jgi:hypothetical protein